LSRASRFNLLLALLLAGGIGCWEQWSNDWFPQMKWQKAVQAFERTMHNGKVDAFMPPAGTVPIDGGEAPVSNVIDSASDVLVNPRPMTLASVENGRAQYETYCITCHGPDGMGNGPVSMTGPIQGPFGGVLPLVVTTGRSDGHVYTTIRYGRRRMPSYGRIPSEDRWDIVNYVRYLTKQRGIE
jgi:cytochrome c553